MTRKHFYTTLGSIAFSFAILLPFNAAQAQCANDANRNDALCHQLQNQQNGNNQAAADAQYNARIERENARVARKIEKLRNTLYYTALFASNDTISVGKAGWYADRNDAIKKASSFCRGSCELVAVYANTCVAMAQLRTDTVSNRHLVIATDPDAETALNKAHAQCETKYGKNQCIMKMRDTAQCAGYDYGFYNQ